MSGAQDGNAMQEQPAPPSLCASGCGFFANVGCGGLCSKCHRSQAAEQAKNFSAAEAAVVEAASVPPQPAEVAKPAEPAAAQPSAPVSIPAPATASASSEQPAAAASPSSAAPAAPCPNPSRCNLAECRKKVGLTGFKCKCGLVFCGQHRYAEAHNCTFDYVSDGRLKLAANNPVVSAAKVAKI